MTNVSFQLYSARNFPPLSDILALLGSYGYAEVEGFGGIYAPLDEAGIKALKSELDANGLRMATGHFGLDQLENETDRMIALAKTLNMDSVYCPFVMPNDRPSDKAGWLAFGARLEKAGKPFRDAGFDFGWHNHDFEFATAEDGSVIQDLIMQGGPTLSWEIDVAWVVRGKADPLKWIAKYADRITSAHIKDLAPAGEKTDEGGWADVGHGTMDWKGIWQALKATKAKHFVVEHDNPSDVARAASRSLETIKSL